MERTMRKCLILILTVLLTMAFSVPVSAAKTSISFEKAKVTVRDITVCGFRGWRGGCDGLRSSASFRLILEKAAGFTNFAVKN